MNDIRMLEEQDEAINDECHCKTKDIEKGEEFLITADGRYPSPKLPENPGAMPDAELGGRLHDVSSDSNPAGVRLTCADNDSVDDSDPQEADLNWNDLFLGKAAHPEQLVPQRQESRLGQLDAVRRAECGTLPDARSVLDEVTNREQNTAGAETEDDEFTKLQEVIPTLQNTQPSQVGQHPWLYTSVHMYI